MTVSEEVEKRVMAKIQDCLDLASAHFKRDFKMPKVTYSQATRVAGWARQSTWQVEFSAIFLMDPANVEEMVNATVPHEIAHLIAGAVYPEINKRVLEYDHFGRPKWSKRDIHGEDWKRVMRLFGVAPNRCHDMRVSAEALMQPRRTSAHVGQCPVCKLEFNLSAKKAEQCKQGLIYHPGCGGKRFPIVLLDNNGIVPAPVSNIKPVAKPTPVLVTKPTPVTGVPVASSTGSKMDICRTLFSLNKGMSRGDMINLFIAQAGCTKAGASTYYQTCKSATK